MANNNAIWIAGVVAVVLALAYAPKLDLFSALAPTESSYDLQYQYRPAVFDSGSGYSQTYPSPLSIGTEFTLCPDQGCTVVSFGYSRLNNYIQVLHTQEGMQLPVPVEILATPDQGIQTDSGVQTGTTLQEGQFMKIGSYLEPLDKNGNLRNPGGYFNSQEIDKMLYAPITYREKDGQVHTGQFTRGSSFDITALDPAIGGSGVSGKAIESVVINMPPANIPTPAGYHWILQNQKCDSCGSC